MAVRRRSAGILLVRAANLLSAGEATAEFLLVHPGGPFWAKKDTGAWSIPKGELDDDENAELCARREFREELGVECPAGELIALGEVIQPGGKRVEAWCGLGDLDVAAIESNMFEMEWPPRSGRREHFPEVDRAGWFALGAAEKKILAGQRPFLDRARRALRDRGPLTGI